VWTFRSFNTAPRTIRYWARRPYAVTAQSAAMTRNTKAYRPAKPCLGFQLCAKGTKIGHGWALPARLASEQVLVRP
jgi:hypothetical protein